MSVLDGPLVLVDIETNGLNHLKGRVIEVAALRIEGGQVVRTFNQLVDPGTELPQFITRLTGIAQTDLRDAPLFAAVADDLHEVLDDAIFVAHNVRFDYAFLKQEFKRIGKHFAPRQLCTARLSRALYPEHRSHKLASLIERHGFSFAQRHRAYDDAAVLWQFLQHVRQQFDAGVLETAIARQLKRPSLPKSLDPGIIEALPESPGVYIMEDEQGRALYVGKSVNVKKRVMSHFTRDHDNVSEFKISQTTHHITTHETPGELSALLLESRLIKELQPLHNKLLRRTDKLLVARQAYDAAGYVTVTLEEVSRIEPAATADILAVYPRRGRARDSLESLAKDHGLCPKLLGLEKANTACFWHQLRKCQGACIKKELADTYNTRVRNAFARLRIEDWPFGGAVLVQEQTAAAVQHGIVVDNWCIVAEVTQEPYCEPVITQYPALFDLDAYKILRTYLTAKIRQLRVQPITFAAGSLPTI